MNSGISIVIPTFERTDLLLETIASVEAQTIEQWECLIVDDGSSEQHLAAITGRIGKDSRFRLIKRTGEVRGASVCRNVGWKAAKHELVTFIDSDDLLTPECTFLRLRMATRRPDCDFWVFSTMTFDQVAGDRDVLLNVPTIEDNVLRFLKMDVVWLSTGPLWKKATLSRLGGWDESLLSWQDWDLSLRALLLKQQFVHFSEVDNYFRVQSLHRSSIGRESFSPAHLESHQKLVTKICGLAASSADYTYAASFLFFWIADQWIRNKELLRGLRVWRSSSPHLSETTYLLNVAALLLLSLPKVGNHFRNILERQNHPAFRYWKGTFKRVRSKFGDSAQGIDSVNT